MVWGFYSHLSFSTCVYQKYILEYISMKFIISNKDFDQLWEVTGKENWNNFGERKNNKRSSHMVPFTKIPLSDLSDLGIWISKQDLMFELIHHFSSLSSPNITRFRIWWDIHEELWADDHWWRSSQWKIQVQLNINDDLVPWITPGPWLKCSHNSLLQLCHWMMTLTLLKKWWG